MCQNLLIIIYSLINSTNICSASTMCQGLDVEGYRGEQNKVLELKMTQKRNN